MSLKSDAMYKKKQEATNTFVSKEVLMNSQCQVGLKYSVFVKSFIMSKKVAVIYMPLRTIN